MREKQGWPQVLKDSLRVEAYGTLDELIDLGGILATVPDQEFKNMPQVTGNDVKKLEKMIDGCQKALALPQEFILPGGGKVSAFSIRRERFVDGESGCACTSRGKSRWAR